jgi:hypothetical protein
VAVVIASPERAKQSHKNSCRGLIHQTRILMMRLPGCARNGGLLRFARKDKGTRMIVTFPLVARNDFVITLIAFILVTCNN